MDLVVFPPAVRETSHRIAPSRFDAVLWAA
jgi:hypothetical protein